MEKREAPAAERNKHLIRDVFKKHVPGRRVLEIASGTGQHVALLAEASPSQVFQPTEFDADNLGSIRAWTEGMSNVREAKMLDVCDSKTWDDIECDGMLCVNMIHIAPYKACEGLASCAAKSLSQDGTILLYGPFLQEGVETVQSNIDFDQWLKEQNREYGIRKLSRVKATFAENGLELDAVIEMPANNLCVVFRRSA